MILARMEQEIQRLKDALREVPEAVPDWEREQLASLEETYERMLGNKFSMIDVDSMRDAAYDQAKERAAEYGAWLTATESLRTEEEQEEAQFCLSPLRYMENLPLPREMPEAYREKYGEWAWEAADFLDGNFPRVYMMLKYRQDKEHPWMSLLERACRDLENSMDKYHSSMTEAGASYQAASQTAWNHMVGAVTKEDEYVDPDMDMERGDGEWLPAWVMEALNQIY